jgi:hypothetical protein
MTRSIENPFTILVALTAAAGLSFAQGPGSCGFHLDILANLTSTHSAVADVQSAPGSGAFPYPPGFPGNPYSAYATPGSTITLRVSVPPGTLSPAPFGAGSIVSIFWAVGTPNVLVMPPAGTIAPCWPGQPWVISVLPWGGALVDGTGLTGAIPLPPPSDPGFPDKLELTVNVPLVVPGAAIMFQAVLVTPQNLIAVTNGVSLMAGPNPSEASLLPLLVAVCGGNPVDDGVAPIPMPPGFTFYGFPAPMANVLTNGYVDFLPVVGGICDFTGSLGDLGCAPPTNTASPRIAVNHFDANFAIAVPPPLVSDLTLEIAPPAPGLPTRHILRWKNVAPFGAPMSPPAIDTDYASMAVEFWGADFPGGQFIGPSTMIVVRQETHAVTTMAHHELVGIGPGLVNQGFGGPPPVCIPVPGWSVYGVRPGFMAPLGAAIYQDSVYDSSITDNLAIVFMPQMQIPVLPLNYSIDVY